MHRHLQLLHASCQIKAASSGGQLCILEVLRACWRGVTWWRILLLLHAALLSCVHSRRRCNQHQLLSKALPLQGVSLRAAISTLYRSSSLPTRAVLRWSLSERALSIRVRKFHAPMVKGITCVLFFLVWPLSVIPADQSGHRSPKKVREKSRECHNHKPQPPLPPFPSPPRPQEEEETDKPKQAQTEQTYEKH